MLIGLVQGSRFSVSSWAIRLVTGSWWSHAFLMFPEHEGVEVPVTVKPRLKSPLAKFFFDRKKDKLQNPTKLDLYTQIDASESRGFITWTNINRYKNRELLIYEVPDNELLGFSYAREREGTEYGYNDILGYLGNSNNEDTDFCSEFCFNTLFKMGYSPSRINKKLSPRVLFEYLDSLTYANSSKVKRVFEGKLKGLKQWLVDQY